jgi:hypothetical protein
MTNVLPVRRLTASALALLVAIGASSGRRRRPESEHERRRARPAGWRRTSSAPSRCERSKRLQETYAQYSQFGLWTDMAALFADNAQLSYGKDNEQGRQAIRELLPHQVRRGHARPQAGGLHTQMVCGRSSTSRPTARARRAAGGNSR